MGECLRATGLHVAEETSTKAATSSTSAKAFFSHLAERHLLAREVCCAAQGAPVCAFIITGPSRKADLERALEASGADAGRVLRLLSEQQVDPAEQSPSDALATL